MAVGRLSAAVALLVASWVPALPATTPIERVTPNCLAPIPTRSTPIGIQYLAATPIAMAARYQLPDRDPIYSPSGWMELFAGDDLPLVLVCADGYCSFK
jgi:hypothetical protein